MIIQRSTLISSLALLVVVIIVEVANAGPPSKIVGGDEAELGEFPYIVSLRKDGEHFCGGAIVDSKHVLTASHCVHNNMEPPYSDITVLTGTILSFKGGKTYTVSKAIVHKGFDVTVPISSHDIALLKLKSEIKFNNYTSAINLPRAVTPGGLSAVVAGWGDTSEYTEMGPSTLQKARMTTVGPKKCQSMMEDSQIFTEQICAFNVRGIGTCYGDSGGPLAVGKEIVGVASYSLPCARGVPDVYTAVYYYVDWIKNNMK